MTASTSNMLVLAPARSHSRGSVGHGSVNSSARCGASTPTRQILKSANVTRPPVGVPNGANPIDGRFFNRFKASGPMCRNTNTSNVRVSPVSNAVAVAKAQPSNSNPTMREVRLPNGKCILMNPPPVNSKRLNALGVTSQDVYGMTPRQVKQLTSCSRFRNAVGRAMLPSNSRAVAFRRKEASFLPQGSVIEHKAIAHVRMMALQDMPVPHRGTPVVAAEGESAWALVQHLAPTIEAVATEQVVEEPETTLKTITNLTVREDSEDESEPADTTRNSRTNRAKDDLAIREQKWFLKSYFRRRFSSV
eukprot:Colp12_sorted_trinity150504_noHs@17273